MTQTNPYKYASSNSKFHFETTAEYISRGGKIQYCPPRSAAGITGAPKKFLPDDEKVEAFVRKTMKKTKKSNKKKSAKKKKTKKSNKK